MWDIIKKLIGCTIYTVGRDKPFQIMEVTETTCTIRVESTGKPRLIQKKEFENALRVGNVSSLTPSLLRQKGASEVNPAYVVAILKHIYN